MNMMQNNTHFKRKSKISLLVGTLIVMSLADLSAQVKFQLEKLPDGQTFQVSMMSLKSWASPKNTTSTAQVTLKVPTNSFEITELVNLQPDVNWEYNSKTRAPVESPQYDYLSIGLASMGTMQLHYEEGIVVPLFTFKNASICQGSISLMEPNDPFKAPNSRKVNVGNSITIFGAQGEAYQENGRTKIIPCEESLPAKVQTVATPIDAAPVLYPNPATDQVFIEMQWTDVSTTGELMVLDFNGRIVLKQAVSLGRGSNKFDVIVKNLPSGMYTVELNEQGKTTPLSRFVKHKN